MLIAYDTEFIEDGHTIDLISIGMVAEDGRELYAVSSEFDRAKAQQHPFVRPHVLPYLPARKQRCRCSEFHLDLDHPDVRTRPQMARMVQEFVRESGPEVQLWADHAAYDHVALAQLFGRMIDLPEGVPMHTNDLRTLMYGRSDDELPARDVMIDGRTGEHHALADARWLMLALRRLGAATKIRRKTGSVTNTVGRVSPGATVVQAGDVHGGLRL